MKHNSDYIKTLANSGSAAPNLNRGQFAKISVALPPDEVLKRFDEINRPADLTDDEIVFYGALVENGSAKEVMTDEQLREIARALVV